PTIAPKSPSPPADISAASRTTPSFPTCHQNSYDTASRFPIVPADLQAVHTLPLAGVPDILRSDPGEVLRASRQAERTSSNCFARRERCGFPGERRDRRLETAPDTAMIYSRRF